MQRPVLSASLTILFCLGAYGQSPSPSPTPLIDTLTTADLDRAIPLIRENYLNPPALNDTELKRATLAGLLDRFGNGVMLLPGRTSPKPSPAPFYREIIGGHIGYLRPGDLSRTQLQELDTTLRGLAGKKVDAIVLDLRGSVETSDYEGAAEFANRFLPKGRPLFSLQGPSQSAPKNFVSETAPLYVGLIILLVDGDTAGANEVLAAVLRTVHGSIVVGERTAGRAVDYSDQSLPSGKVLRIATAEAVLAEGEPRIPNGLKPDLAVNLSPDLKQQIFQQSLTKGMATFVFETDQPHLNEAALIAGTNPEIETAQTRGRSGEKSSLHDPVLQRGVDLVTSIEVYEKQTGRAP
jgi:Peptidase family S41